jgi:anti-sigma regulatory factor (Ser/Thr protein kinase)
VLVHHELCLSSTPEATGLGRNALGGWLDDAIGVEAATDARLATNELIANVVRHSGLETGTPFVLRIDHGHDGLRVEVEQETSAGRVHISDPADRGPTGGFGLLVIDALVDRWGVEPGPPGRVWFELHPAEPG